MVAIPTVGGGGFGLGETFLAERARQMQLQLQREQMSQQRQEFEARFSEQRRQFNSMQEERAGEVERQSSDRLFALADSQQARRAQLDAQAIQAGTQMIGQERQIASQERQQASEARGAEASRQMSMRRFEMDSRKAAEERESKARQGSDKLFATDRLERMKELGRQKRADDRIRQDEEEGVRRSQKERSELMLRVSASEARVKVDELRKRIKQIDGLMPRTPPRQEGSDAVGLEDLEAERGRLEDEIASVQDSMLGQLRSFGIELGGDPGASQGQQQQDTGNGGDLQIGPARGSNGRGGEGGELIRQARSQAIVAQQARDSVGAEQELVNLQQDKGLLPVPGEERKASDAKRLTQIKEKSAILSRMPLGDLIPAAMQMLEGVDADTASAIAASLPARAHEAKAVWDDPDHETVEGIDKSISAVKAEMTQEVDTISKDGLTRTKGRKGLAALSLQAEGILLQPAEYMQVLQGKRRHLMSQMEQQRRDTAEADIEKTLPGSSPGGRALRSRVFQGEQGNTRPTKKDVELGRTILDSADLIGVNNTSVIAPLGVIRALQSYQEVFAQNSEEATRAGREFGREDLLKLTPGLFALSRSGPDKGTAQKLVELLIRKGGGAEDLTLALRRMEERGKALSRDNILDEIGAQIVMAERRNALSGQGR